MNWLLDFTYRNNALHFVYYSTGWGDYPKWCQTPDGTSNEGCKQNSAKPMNDRLHYRRFNLSQNRFDIDSVGIECNGSSPPSSCADLAMLQLGGSNILPIAGFFTFADSTPASPLFFTTNDKSRRLVVIASDDNGQTWRLHARGGAAEGIYAVSGARRPTASGQIIGAFTANGKEQSYGV